jgi:hypothetical protein
VGLVSCNHLCLWSMELPLGGTTIK